MTSNYSVASTAATYTSTSSTSTAARYPKKIFLNVSRCTSEAQLRRVMQEYGQVNSVHIPVDRETGQSRGFAFVTFRWHEAAVRAMEGLEGSALDGLILRDVRWATLKNKKDDNKKKPKRNGSSKKKSPQQKTNNGAVRK